MGGEVGNFTGVICIGKGIWPWTTARVDYDGKIDIGVGRDPVAFSAMILLLVILWIFVIFGALRLGPLCMVGARAA